MTEVAAGRPARIQRPPAEVRYADELARLRESDDGERPPGWALSLAAARRFVVGDESAGISRKFVGDPSLVERALVTLAADRGLLLVGEPGTAKSLLSELLAAAVSGDSTLTVQGTAGTTEDHIRYSWNYALLVAEGPSERSLVPSPVLRGMAEGARCGSRRSPAARRRSRTPAVAPVASGCSAIPELTARREVSRGVQRHRDGEHPGSRRQRDERRAQAAVQLRDVPPIADLGTELALVEAKRAKLADRVRRAASDVLRSWSPRSAISAPAGRSTAGARAPVLGDEHRRGGLGGARGRASAAGSCAGEAGTADDLVACLAGTAAKDNADDLAKLRRYLEQQVTRRKGRAVAGAARTRGTCCPADG